MSMFVCVCVLLSFGSEVKQDSDPARMAGLEELQINSLKDPSQGTCHAFTHTSSTYNQ